MVETLLELLFERLEVLAGGARDGAKERAYSDAAELAQALRDLHAMDAEIEERLKEAFASYRRARRSATAALADPPVDLDDPDLDDPDLEDLPMPIRVATRPAGTIPAGAATARSTRSATWIRTRQLGSH